MPGDVRRRTDARPNRTCQPVPLVGQVNRATTGSSRLRLWDSADTTPHIVILLLAVLTVFLACTLNVSDQRRIVIPVANVSLPGICMYRQFLAHDCPGCGLTRSFVSLANGDIVSACSYNAVGSVFFVIVVFQIPYRALQIWRLTHGRSAIRLCSELWVIWPLLIALLAQWLIRLIVEWSG